ncbi:MAG: restriction endonuclease subunit S, partial [Bacteroidales bacterium]
KQYEYYRDSLLTFGDNVEWKTLGEIGEVRMCKRILKEQTSDVGVIPFYKIGTFGKEPNAYISKELFDEYKSKYNYPRIGEVLISASGTIGRAVIFDGKDAYFQDSNIVWIENDESQVLNKYLFYFYQIAKWEIAEGGTIQRLYNENLKKTKIPIPFPKDIKKSLAEQERIVSILDKFDKLTNSISEGLPAEIKARQQQYEYYREKLLSFPMAAV